MQAVKISAMDDGTFAVEVESEMPEMPEGGEMPDPSMGAMDMPEQGETGETFVTLEDALEAAREILSGQSVTKKPMMEGEADFLAGFNGARGSQGV